MPDGGGWRLHGHAATVAHRHKKAPLGSDFLHVAVDNHSRLADVETQPENGATCARFLHRAVGWFRHHNGTVRRVLTNNVRVYCPSAAWTAVCLALQLKQRSTK